MANQDSGLSEVERKAIAHIRRELDTEFGPLEEARPLDLREEAATPDAGLDEPWSHAWSSRPGVVAAFVAGLLIGVLAGGVGTLVWLLHTSSP